MTSKSKKKKINKDVTIIRILIINIISFVLGLSLFAVSSIIPQTLLIPPIVLSILVGLISTYLLSDKLVKPLIEEWIESDTENARKEFDKDIVDILKRQELYLLYTLQKIYQSVKSLNLDNIISNEEYLISRLEIDIKVRQDGELEELYDQALEDLLEADKTDKLKDVVRTTLSRGLSIKNNDDRYPELSDSIYAYLRAWLVCSIKYRRYMPVEMILDSTANINTHKKAIRYIRDTILGGKNKNLLIPSDKSINIIKEYLDKLIEMIQKTL